MNKLYIKEQLKTITIYKLHNLLENIVHVAKTFRQHSILQEYTLRINKIIKYSIY